MDEVLNDKVTNTNVDRINKRKKKRKYITGLVFVGVIFVCILACGIYLSNYYHADTVIIDAYTLDADVERVVLEDETIAYIPENADTGFIFYPGGKVEYTAYEPLMKTLANEEILCILVKMPFHLAVFDINAAEGFPEMYPEIKNWYIGGHSLGGSMAASFLSENAEEFEGIVLLGSYSTADLSNLDLEVLSIYGSEDLVLNRENYAESIANLPNDYKEIILEGGCHAYFGVYGEQEGDGIPMISNEEQIQLTTEYILDFMNVSLE